MHISAVDHQVLTLQGSQYVHISNVGRHESLFLQCSHCSHISAMNHKCLDLQYRQCVHVSAVKHRSQTLQHSHYVRAGTDSTMMQFGGAFAILQNMGRAGPSSEKSHSSQVLLLCALSSLFRRVSGFKGSDVCQDLCFAAAICCFSRHSSELLPTAQLS